MGREFVFGAVVIMILVIYVVRRTRPPNFPTSLSPAFDMYVINLDRMPERMSKFMARLASTDMAGLAPIRLSAIDGRKIEVERYVTPAALAQLQRAERLGYRERHYELTRGGVGCALSHRAAWERLVQSDKDQAMICEDDAELDSSTLRNLHVQLAGIPDDWDILLLGYWCVKCTSFSTHKEMQRFFGLHSYLIRRRAVAKIRSYTGDTVAQQEDSMLSDMCSEGRLRVYGLPEKLAVQTGGDTSVQMPLRRGKSVSDPWASLPVVLALKELRANA